MTIGEMHVWFRQYAQQMGMQNVRAILPEQIDLLINTSITDTVNELIRTNVGLTNDRVITDNSKIGQINALRSLYKVQNVLFTGTAKRVSFNITIKTPSTDSNDTISQLTFGFSRTDTGANVDFDGGNAEGIAPYLYEKDDIVSKFSAIGVTITTWSVASDNRTIQIVGNFKTNGFGNYSFNATGMYFDNSEDSYKFFNMSIHTSYDTNGKAVVNYSNESNDYWSVYNNRTDIQLYDFADENYYSGLLRLVPQVLDGVLYYVDFSIQYKHGTSGLGVGIKYDDTFSSNLYPVRLIDDAYLADTLNDFILKPRFRSPVMVMYNDTIDLYFGKLTKDGDKGYFLDGHLVPYMLRVAYISKPAQVYFGEDANIPNVNCDLPEYMHVDILKHAVELYRQAVSGGLDTTRNNQAAQQQENARNTFRNEGFTQ